jgi:hypothetical protein
VSHTYTVRGDRYPTLQAAMTAAEAEIWRRVRADRETLAAAEATVESLVREGGREAKGLAEAEAEVRRLSGGTGSGNRGHKISIYRDDATIAATVSE